MSGAVPTMHLKFRFTEVADLELCRADRVQDTCSSGPSSTICANLWEHARLENPQEQGTRKSYRPTNSAAFLALGSLLIYANSGLISQIFNPSVPS